MSNLEESAISELDSLKSQVRFLLSLNSAMSELLTATEGEKENLTIENRSYKEELDYFIEWKSNKEKDLYLSGDDLVKVNKRKVS